MTASQFLDIEALREIFPVTQSKVYLDHAAIAPLSEPVRTAMEGYLADRATWRSPDKYQALTEDLRETLAELINAASAEIGLVQNTSEGLNTIASSLPLQAGDNVVFCDMEFPSNVYPWMNLERRGVEARCIPHDTGGLTVDSLESHADGQTRVVTVSSVQFLTGSRTDLAALGTWCREHGVYFVVDGIQSLGVLPMDVQRFHIDFLSCGGPKWLMGPAGQGFIYCRQELLDHLTPPFAGCMSVAGWEDWRDYSLTFLPTVARFELGCANIIGQAGLLAAVRLLLHTGIEAIERRVLHLTDLLVEDLEQHGYDVVSDRASARRSSIVSFSVPSSVESAFDKLIESGIVVSKREQYIRVSPHCYNTEEEILRLCKTLGHAK